MDVPQQASEVGLGSDGLVVQLLLILILTLINAFFAASEMALVSVNQNRLKRDAEDGDKKAIKILDILADQSNFLSTIQVAITLAGFFNSAAAAVGISQRLGVYFNNLGVPYAFTVSTVVITLILSYITIVFGELVPKRIALIKSEEFARFSVGVIKAAAFLFKPFVKLLSFSTNLILRLFGISTDDVEGKITINDIKSLVQLGQTQGVIDEVESDMINSVIGFDDTYAEEIMTARPEVFMIDINEPFEEYLDEMLNLKYSRIPVYEDEVDNIIGILYLKDYLLASYNSGFENVDIRSILKPVYFVPERKNVNDLFSELQTNNRHMALLIDEYGGFSGIVTMEDLIEEIVGEIDDEYDHDEPEINQITDDIWMAKGSSSIKEINFRLDLKLDEKTEDYDTLGGLLIFLLGHVPEDGEQITVEYQNLIFEILEVAERRIQEVKITVLEEEE
ncbi:MAG: HlyC/CorC family transporter [Tissierellia bacterium]|nr:HlyC/CorC family transporter [Tissierellia bacterium]